MAKLRWIPLCAFLVAIASTAGAFPIPPFVSSTATLYSEILTPEHTLGPAVFDCTDAQQGSALAPSSCAGGYSTGVIGSGSASGVSAYGLLKVQSSAQATAGLGGADANASAQFGDTVSSSQAGVLHIEMTVHGNVSYTDTVANGSSAFAYYNLAFYTPDFSTVLAGAGRTFDVPGDASAVGSIEYPVLPGQVLVLYARLVTDAGVSMSGGTDPSFASANFFNTAAISRVELLDSNGQPIPDAAFTFGSGATYPVPEPSAALLVVAGAAGIATTRKPRSTPD